MKRMDVKSAETRQAHLRALVRGLGSVLVAYSGGVDSTLLAYLARDVLGDRALAVTASSLTRTTAELAYAESLAHDIGIRHLVIETDEMDDPLFVANDPRRCYHCKRRLFQRLHIIAIDKGLENVADGTNCDDRSEYRPGSDAAIEFGIISPLSEAGLGKQEVRLMARSLHLPNWDMPSSPCLATRIQHGTPITAALLGTIAAAEGSLRKLGLTDFRVRHHGDTARIEASPADVTMLNENSTWQRAVSELGSLGYSRVVLDPAGHRA